MGRELQKKKRKSSIPKVKLKPKSKKLNIFGNSIVAANWDHRKTLSQNYKRLGLTSRLNSSTGGIEKIQPLAKSQSSNTKDLHISNREPQILKLSEAQLKRDPISGKVIQVIHTNTKANPLNDTISSESENEEIGTHGEACQGFRGKTPSSNNIIRQLEEQALCGAETQIRKQSERERNWIETMVLRYGDDYKKMARDKKLNPMQQTPHDIQRRILKWRSIADNRADENVIREDYST